MIHSVGKSSGFAVCAFLVDLLTGGRSTVDRSEGAPSVRLACEASDLEVELTFFLRPEVEVDGGLNGVKLAINPVFSRSLKLTPPQAFEFRMLFFMSNIICCCADVKFSISISSSICIDGSGSMLLVKSIIDVD